MSSCTPFSDCDEMTRSDGRSHSPGCVLNGCTGIPLIGSGNQLCILPPTGWFCTRKKGHEGPCAAKPCETRTEAQIRKGRPVATGVMKYFPDALRAVAEVSRIGNDQHNPGQPLHWAKEKSTGEPDALARHLLDWLEGLKFEADGGRVSAKIAWRALALCQREIDAEKAAVTKRAA